MTRAEIRTLALSWLDDPDGGYFTSAQMNVFINNAQREVQKQLVQAGQNYYLKRAETTTVVGQADYILPTDFLKSHRLEWIDSGTGTNESRIQIYPITVNQQNITTPALGIPAVYSLLQERFTLYPTPQSAKVVRLYYSYRVTDMSADSDTPDVPADYHEYIAILAAMDGFVKDDRAPQNLVKKMEDYKVLMKQTADDRRQDKPRRVLITDEY